MWNIAVQNFISGTCLIPSKLKIVALVGKVLFWMAVEFFISVRRKTISPIFGKFACMHEITIEHLPCKGGAVIYICIV